MRLARLHRGLNCKRVNTVPEAVSVWPVVRYISDTSQYRCTVSSLPLFFNIYIYVCMCVCVCVCIIINIKVYHKIFPQFRTNYSWFQTLVSIKRKRKKKKHNIKNRNTNNTNKLMQISYHSTLTKIQKLRKKKKKTFFLDWPV